MKTTSTDTLDDLMAWMKQRDAKMAALLKLVNLDEFEFMSWLRDHLPKE